MLIYSGTGSINGPPRAVTYKTNNNQKQTAIRSRTSKRKVQSSRKPKKATPRKRKKQKLSAKNKKFLKSLGFRVKNNQRK